MQRWRSFNVESLLRFSRQGDCAGAVYRGAEEQRSKGVEVQKFRGSEVQGWRWRCFGAEFGAEQVHSRGADVQEQSCRGFFIVDAVVQRLCLITSTH